MTRRRQDLLERLEDYRRRGENEDGRSEFAGLLNELCCVLNWDDKRAALHLSTSEPVIRRWRNGLVVPAIHLLAACFMAEDLRHAMALMSEPAAQENG